MDYRLEEENCHHSFLVLVLRGDQQYFKLRAGVFSSLAEANNSGVQNAWSRNQGQLIHD
jgi:hypothetical protein